MTDSTPLGDVRPEDDSLAPKCALVRYPTDMVMCSACSGTGEYDWGEIDIFTTCGTCGGVGEVEVCAQCHDSGDECGACGV